MKNFTNIKANLASLMILTPSQMLNVKGGLDAIFTVSVVTDDKRRDRPGGGITTL